MVNRGPSRGCYLCRKRHVKCDGGRPGCERCLNYHGRCPGYPDPAEFKFVCENRSLQFRSRRCIPSKLQHCPECSQTCGRRPFAPRSHLISPSPTPCPNISTVWEDLCIPYFLHEWTFPASYSQDMGFLHFLPELAKESSADSCLATTLTAISYASFAHQRHHSSLVARSRLSYGHALRAVNRALQDPAEAIKDSTLTSILMLQMYEHIDSQDYHQHNSHEVGLRLLLQLRGEDQFRTSRGHHLYRNVVGYLRQHDTRSSGPNKGPLPLDFDKLRISSAHPAIRYHRLNNIKTTFLSQITSLLCLDPSGPIVQRDGLALLRASADLDAQYASWFANLPERWQPRLVSVSGSWKLAPTNGRVYTFAVPTPPCIMASARTHRAMMHKEVVALAVRLGVAEWTSETEIGKWSLSRCREVIREQYEEILSTAAFTLGELDDGVSAWYFSSSSSPDSDDSSPPVSILSLVSEKTPLRGRCVLAFYMMWPLLHVYKDGNGTSGQKADARRCLEYMGHVLGIRRCLAEI